MLNHVVLMKFKAGVSRAEVDALEKNLDALPNRIVEIQMYEFGRDVIGSDRSYDFAIVALFANTEALDRYNSHPDHLAVLEKINNICANIVTVDFEGTDASDLREKMPESMLPEDF
jgi:hypothetical protein